MLNSLNSTFTVCSLPDMRKAPLRLMLKRHLFKVYAQHMRIATDGMAEMLGLPVSEQLCTDCLRNPQIHLSRAALGHIGRNPAKLNINAPT